MLLKLVFVFKFNVSLYDSCLFRKKNYPYFLDFLKNSDQCEHTRGRTNVRIVTGHARPPLPHSARIAEFVQKYYIQSPIISNGILKD